MPRRFGPLIHMTTGHLLSIGAHPSAPKSGLVDKGTSIIILPRGTLLQHTPLTMVLPHMLYCMIVMCQA